jgi:transposase
VCDLKNIDFTMKPYPQELRVRVVAAVEQGELSIPEVVNLFNVSST